MPEEIRIVVDDREARSGMPDRLRCLDGVSVEVRRLALGDYILDDLLLVERKTLLDLTESIKDGRLFSQARRLAEAPMQGLIILEGRAGSLTASRMRREAIQGALITVTVFLGIPLLRSLDPQETLRLMFYIAYQGRAIADGGLPRKGKRPRGRLPTQLYILQGLPGIGPGRARRLLNAFGTVEAVLAADGDALKSVDGIGSTTVERIRWAIREADAPYNLAAGGIRG